MTLSISAIRTAIKQAMQGDIGSTSRKLDSAVFAYAEFIGHPIEKLQAIAQRAQLSRNWFDVDIGYAQDSAATSASVMVTRRIVTIETRIDIIRYVLSTESDEARVAAKDSILEDALSAAHVLAFPGNLSTTEDGTATGIVSGCMATVETPRVGAITYDWDLHLLRVSMPTSATVRYDY